MSKHRHPRIWGNWFEWNHIKIWFLLLCKDRKKGTHNMIVKLCSLEDMKSSLLYVQLLMLKQRLIIYKSEKATVVVVMSFHKHDAMCCWANTISQNIIKTPLSSQASRSGNGDGNTVKLRPIHHMLTQREILERIASAGRWSDVYCLNWVVI